MTEECLDNLTLVTNRGEDAVNISSLAGEKQIKLLYELPPDLHCQRLRSLKISEIIFYISGAFWNGSIDQW